METVMDANDLREEFEIQTKQFEAAMKQLEELGNAGLDIPEEVLRSITRACEPSVRTSTKTIVGIRS